MSVMNLIRAALDFFLSAPSLDSVVLGLSNWQWIGLVCVLGFSGLLSTVFSRLGGRILKHHVLDKAHDHSVRAFPVPRMVKPINLLAFVWFVFIGLYSLDLSVSILGRLDIGVRLLTYIGVVWAGWIIADLSELYLSKRAEKTESKFDDLLAPLASRTLKAMLLTVAAMSIAELLNFPISSLLAGLGIGGIAIAMAAKDTIANIFGSVTILLDRPFSIGDWVVIGKVEGSVERLGFRSTRVRTFYNSLVSIPNSELLTAVVDNMGQRRFRRIKTELALTYSTPPEKIDAFCDAIRALIQAHPSMRKDYYHVYFTAFSDSSLSVLLYCFLETPDWGTELKERHCFFLDILRTAKELGVEFAYPTQTLFLEKSKEQTA